MIKGNIIFLHTATFVLSVWVLEKGVKINFNASHEMYYMYIRGEMSI